MDVMVCDIEIDRVPLADFELVMEVVEPAEKVLDVDRRTTESVRESVNDAK